MAFDIETDLLEQLVWHWEHQARPRLDGLTDEEYFWEPGEGCWNVRHRGTSHAPLAVGSGAFTIDFAYPEPSPAPVTTIAWRLGHILVGVLGTRNAAHFDGPPVSYEDFDYPGTAGGAGALRNKSAARGVEGAPSRGPGGLDSPGGPAEGPYAERPMAALVLHINREMIHHLAEVALLRDLFTHRQ